MKNILFIAPPAGGKGTLSEELVENYGYEHISTGDLLRDLDKSTPLGKEVAAKLATGVFIDDETVLKLLKDKLMTLQGKPFILDGCPRNLKQAAQVDDMLRELGLKLDLAIGLEVPYDVLLQRVVGRVSCKECKSTYNTVFKKPLRDGLCDKCGATLTHRSDDTQEAFKVRYDTYLEQTNPLKEYYSNLGKYWEVDGVDEPLLKVVELIKK